MVRKVAALLWRLEYDTVNLLTVCPSSSPGPADAENSRAGLEKRIARLLSSNAELTIRMRTLIDVFAHIRGPAASLVNYRLASQREPTEDDLAGSTSSRSPQTQTWSTLSGYTLADLPIMSVIPIPVTIGELLDGDKYYTFEFARRVSHDLSELMKVEAGQGTSRSLGFILGKPANFTPHLNTSSNSDNSRAISEPIIPSANPTVVVNQATVPQPRKKKRWR